MDFTHAKIIAGDWESLSLFYKTVLGCEHLEYTHRPPGDWLEEMTGIAGLEDVYTKGELLSLPCYGGERSTIELFSYIIPQGVALPPKMELTGLGHIQVEVEDVQQASEKVVANGGCFGNADIDKDYPVIEGADVVYVRDPEGNLLELYSWNIQPSF